MIGVAVVGCYHCYHRPLEEEEEEQEEEEEVMWEEVK